MGLQADLLDVLRAWEGWRGAGRGGAGTPLGPPSAGAGGGAHPCDELHTDLSPPSAGHRVL